MASGSAASDDAVVNAMSHGSFTAAKNRRIGTLNSSATGSKTARAKITSEPYNASTSTASLRSTSMPLVPTVTAIAAPMPMGANAITSPVNLNITWDKPSQNESIVLLAVPAGTCDSATAKMIAKNTICSTSLFAAASKKLCGTVCSMTLLNVACVVESPAVWAAFAPPRSTPTPGFTTFTTMSPTASASVVTISK